MVQTPCFYHANSWMEYVQTGSMYGIVDLFKCLCKSYLIIDIIVEIPIGVGLMNQIMRWSCWSVILEATRTMPNLIRYKLTTFGTSTTTFCTFTSRILKTSPTCPDLLQQLDQLGSITHQPLRYDLHSCESVFDSHCGGAGFDLGVPAHTLPFTSTSFRLVEGWWRLLMR